MPEDEVLEDFDAEGFELGNNLEGPVAVVDITLEVEEENVQEINDVADDESSSPDEDTDEISESDGSDDFDDTNAASTFNVTLRLTLAILCSGILGVLLF